MRLIIKIRLLALGILIVACSIMPPRRQYIKEVKRQVVPKEILNSEWALETFDNKIPDCNLTMKFLGRGQFEITFKGKVYNGDNLWYLVKGSVIEFHTRPLEKFAWTNNNCEMNPPYFALLIQGSKKMHVTKDKMTIVTSDKKEFVFKKV